MPVCLSIKSLSIHLLRDALGCFLLGCFHILAITNNEAMNIGAFSNCVFVFGGYIPRSGIAGSYEFYFYLFEKLPW